VYTRNKFPALDPASFQHPLDRQATGQLIKLRGFDGVTRKFLEFGFERVQYVLNIASSIRVGKNQMAGLHEMLLECCAVLDVPEPELYVTEGDLNAYTAGATRPFIVVHTGLLNALNDEEVLAALAHEVGHIKCGHVLYKSMARAISVAGEVLGEVTLGIGGLLIKPIEMGLRTWDQRSELSADRAALLVVQDARPCMRMLMKLAGGSGRMESQLSVDEFMNQVHAYTEGLDQSIPDRFFRLAAGMHRGSHPFTIERAKALNDWASSAEFEQIAAGNYARLKSPSPGPSDACPACHAAILSTYQFCASCGQGLKAA
jgi:Zn-dependent protease with chaperone function